MVYQWKGWAYKDYDPNRYVSPLISILKVYVMKKFLYILIYLVNNLKKLYKYSNIKASASHDSHRWCLCRCFGWWSASGLLMFFLYFQQAEVPWHLVAVAIFFTLIKLPGPYYPYWGRILIPHIANGGLLRTLWFAFLWYRRPKKAAANIPESVVDNFPEQNSI